MSNFAKNRFVYKNLCLLAFIFLLFPLIVLAHGGEDHDEEQVNIPIAQSGKLNTKLAKTSQAEVLLKYPTPSKGVETNVRVFVTDINTNDPIENADIKLGFTFLSTVSQNAGVLSYGTVYASAEQFEVQAIPSNSPGIYQVAVIFPKAGSYGVKVKVNASNLDASASVLGLIVSEQAVENKHNNEKIFWVIGIVVCSVIFIPTIFKLKKMSLLQRQ